jgi:hypothetical protein
LKPRKRFTKYKIEQAKKFEKVGVLWNHL